MKWRLSMGHLQVYVFVYDARQSGISVFDGIEILPTFAIIELNVIHCSGIQ